MTNVAKIPVALTVVTPKNISRFVLSSIFGDEESSNHAMAILDAVQQSMKGCHDKVGTPGELLCVDCGGQFPESDSKRPLAWAIARGAAPDDRGVVTFGMCGACCKDVDDVALMAKFVAAFNKNMGGAALAKPDEVDAMTASLEAKFEAKN